MKPARRRGKNMSILIGKGLASFIAWQTWVHAQKGMFVTVIREFARKETSWTNIKDGSGVHLFILILNELLYILYLSALLIFQSIWCSIGVQSFTTA